MAIKAKPLMVALTNAAVAELTAGASEVITLTKVLACNVDASAHTVTVYHDTAGSGAVTDNIIINAFPISAGDSRVLPLSSLFLANGSKLWAKADTGAVVNLSINYTVAEQAA